MAITSYWTAKHTSRLGDCWWSRSTTSIQETTFSSLLQAFPNQMQQNQDSRKKCNQLHNALPTVQQHNRSSGRERTHPPLRFDRESGRAETETRRRLLWDDHNPINVLHWNEFLSSLAIDLAAAFGVQQQTSQFELQPAEEQHFAGVAAVDSVWLPAQHVCTENM